MGPAYVCLVGQVSNDSGDNNNPCEGDSGGPGRPSEVPVAVGLHGYTNYISTTSIDFHIVGEG